MKPFTYVFSKKGLSGQLKAEGFTKEEREYGVENCGADWKEQAVKHAEQYMETMSFSKDSLIEQLKFDGFTKEEAEYGAEKGYK